ncbi:hypothetical protein [Paenibacillus radicis (ex Xue et al. 2023)]|uniref:Uncharacterized protein n=1 Tax=Paenibacillus radicis (ex Xue et al. 2023) TaxID=2972489 RepID=A0ABT1YLN0_9BACL|nr:hypothetical protein [Paenibacillus radicis (ex Xue et al. 2023)]MCR8632850.1 hypothetical protein [Paenibacillus radicis (ex Xue et al. 2023)]
MKTIKEYILGGDGAVFGKQALYTLTSNEAGLRDGGSVLDHMQDTSTVAAYVIAMAVGLYCVSKLSKRSSLVRILRISSGRIVEISEEITKVTGRKAVLLGRKSDNKGVARQTLRLEIYRLEEVMLYDLILAIDQEAEIEILSVTSLYGEKGSR